MSFDNLLGEPPDTLLTDDPAAQLITDGTPAAEVAQANPSSSLAWAVLAEEALQRGEDLHAYAFARVGYHRGLDSLRGSGWKGIGPVPWEHEPNRGFLRALGALARAADRIGDDEEAARCSQFLADSSATAAAELLGSSD